MKKILSLICAGMLLSALCAGFFACANPQIEVDWPDPAADCWVFVKTIPGEEMILLAQSGLTGEEARIIKSNYEAELGSDKVWPSANYPGGINNFELKAFEIVPDAITNCYELTMTIDFSDVGVPPIESLLAYGFRGVRISGMSAICKRYFWAYTEEGAEVCVQWFENSYLSHNNSSDILWDGGTIISTSVQKLGTEIHDEPITF